MIDPAQPLVMAVHWTGETEFVAGIGATEDLAIKALRENPEVGDASAITAAKVNYIPLVPRASGWSGETIE